MRRVLVPGGRLVILEITQPKRQPWPAFALWFDRIVPQLGKLAGDSSAYTYLRNRCAVSRCGDPGRQA